jgi:hypothetical protein
LQKQVTNRTIITKDRILTPNHAHDIPNTRHIVSNTPYTPSLTNTRPLTSLTTTRHITRLLTSHHTIASNIHLAKKQTLLPSQYGQINTIKKDKKDNIYKEKKKPKVDKIPIVDPLTKNSREKVTKQKPICYKCKKTGHYQNNCVFDKNCSQTSKSNSKLKTPDLHSEINSLKQEIKEIKTSSFQITEEQLAQEMITLKINNSHPQYPIIEKVIEPQENCKQIVQLITQPNSKETFLNTIDKILFQKWYTEIKIVIDKKYVFETIALLDTGADSTCIQEGLIPKKYYEKTTEKLSQASGASLNIEFKLPNAHVCRDGVCIKTTFILVKDITSKVILGNPFIALLYPIKEISEKGLTTKILGQKITFPFILPPMTRDINLLKQMSFSNEINLIYKSKIARKEKHLMFLQQDLEYKRIEEQLELPLLKQRIENFENKIKNEICVDLPNAFWHRKQHIVNLPYEPDFNERTIPTKARPIQMNQELLEYCKKEIHELLDKGLIRKSKSPWSCSAFYVQKNAEIEIGDPRLVINYKPLNTALKWIRYLIPNKKDLFSRVHNASVFSKFDMKSGFWQTQIDEKDKYKTAFTVHFGHYEWNVMPFGLKNAPSEFQNIMNDIFTLHTNFAIVYIDDVLIFSNSIDQHWKHLETFIKLYKLTDW